MPNEIIKALACIKQFAAQVNSELEELAQERAQSISQVAALIGAGEYSSEFALSVWQTGSGTQTNMNLNEVIAALATQQLQLKDASIDAIHPNDEVNRGQSSNDVFPTAMHIAGAQAICGQLLPALQMLVQTWQHKATLFADVIKVGRTHLQDAAPLTVGQAFTGHCAQLDLAGTAIEQSLPALYALAIGGTAVGTGLNTHKLFGVRVAQQLARHYGLPFVSAGNKFAALAGHEAIAQAHSALKLLAVALAKLANDVRWMASGPRAGLSELFIPPNEPGSSIMPGKVNPTQAEALAMVCLQVQGNDVTVSMAAAQGNFELNVCKPVIAYNFLQSARLLADAMRSFTLHCAQGIEVNRANIQKVLERSLVGVTALAPHIGYDKAALISHLALEHDLPLREAALRSGYLSAQDFDAWANPRDMLAPQEN